jgi:hypothetical protein
MTFVGEVGRLCNQIIRSIAVSLIAEKHDLKVIYYNANRMENLGIPLYSGSKLYATTLTLNDKTYEDVDAMVKLEDNLDVNSSDSYLQTHAIARRVYSYLHKNKHAIISKNPFKELYNNNNDVFVHIRLTDAEKHNPGIDYYLKVLSMLDFDTIHISSDNVNHDIIYRILMAYPDSATIATYEPEETLQFASTCKHVILSHGTFSAMIGYIGYYSNIYFPAYDRDANNWYGDVFYMDGWNAI